MIGVRIATGTAVAAVLGAGVYLSGKIERDSRSRVSDYAAAAPSEAKAEPAGGGSEAGQRAFALRAFDDGVRADAASFGLADPDVVSGVHAAQDHALELEAPIVLSPGRAWTSAHLEIEAVLDKVKYQKLGATVSARHLLAVVRNISKVPVAYQVWLSSKERGRCEVHGARQHNAMALMPGEEAEIVVCAGGGKLQVDRVEVLEISKMGHRYLSRVPPRAVGVDSLSAHAHIPPAGIDACETVDSVGISRALRDGVIQWVDVVDFYSRHSCDRFRYAEAYRYQVGPRETLPAPL